MTPKGKIPDRWIPYQPCGDIIEGTRLICFKVPLHKNVQQRVPGITKIWDIPAVLTEIPKLGAVIDLTNTARYYNPKEFLAANVLHRKILMPGREIPPEAKVREFMDAVDEFLGKDCDTLVGVHCTHGLNRTGYMVCRYMRDRLNIPANDAIERFEKARGYQIEREIYKAGLLNNALPPPDFGRNSNSGWRNNRNQKKNKKKSEKRDWSKSQWKKNGGTNNESEVGSLVQSQTSNVESAAGYRNWGESKESYNANAPRSLDATKESYNTNPARSCDESHERNNESTTRSWGGSQRSYNRNETMSLGQNHTSYNENLKKGFGGTQRNNESATKSWREIQNERRIEICKQQRKRNSNRGTGYGYNNTNNDSEPIQVKKKRKAY